LFGLFRTKEGEVVTAGVTTVGEDGLVELSARARSIYEQEEAAKFLATASASGIPNVALIVSQLPADGGKLIFGEFMMVKTQANLAENPRVASVVITQKLEIAGCKADLAEWTTSGPYVDRINSIGFFRYNAYAGIHNVAVARIRGLLDLPEKLSYPKVGLEFADIRTRGRLGRAASVGGVSTPAPIRAKFDGIMSIKVLAFLNGDGYPNIVPIFSTMFRDPGELRFKVASYNSAVRKVVTPCPVALNVLTMDLMTYQVKGELIRFERLAGFESGVVRIDEAYSSMPPFCGQRVA
jgi:hypothetical protein